MTPGERRELRALELRMDRILNGLPDPHSEDLDVHRLCHLIRVRERDDVLREAEHSGRPALIHAAAKIRERNDNNE